MQVVSIKAKKTLRVRVTFSNHCFSDHFDPVGYSAGDTIIDEDTERPRMFCPTRYRLSFDVPQLVRNLNHPKAVVWQGEHRRNWAFTIQIESPAGPYHVFLEIRRATAEQKKLQDLNLRVESAYHQTATPPILLGSMGFVLLCGKTYMGEPVATKR